MSSFSTPTTPRSRQPPGGVSSIVFDDSLPPVTYTRVSYSLTAASSTAELGSPFSKPARRTLKYSQGSSMKDLLKDDKAPEKPKSRKNRVSPGGPSTIVLE
eukprot:gene3852-4114_t